MLLLLVLPDCAGAGSPTAHRPTPLQLLESRVKAMRKSPRQPARLAPSGSSRLAPRVTTRLAGSPISRNVLVSPNDGNTYTTTAAAINPTNPAQLFAASGATILSGTTPVVEGYGTGDAGQTWSSSSIPLPGTGPNMFAVDPGVAYDTQGNLYATYLPFSVDPSTAAFASQVLVARSSDNGHSWGLPVSIDPQASTPFRPLIAVDNSGSLYRNRTYVAYDVPTSATSDPLMLARSDDGQNWTTTQVFDSGGDLAGFPAVGPNGELYVAWDDWCGGPSGGAACQYSPGRILLAKSLDGGATFSSPRQIALTAIGSGIAPPNYSNPCGGTGPGSTINPSPAIAVDNSGGPHTGTIYAVWTDAAGGRPMHVFFTRSLDGGNSWSPPAQVDLDNNQDAWEASVAVDQSNGAVTIAWYDRRDDPNGVMYRVYYTQSTDGGVTFLPEQHAVSTAQSNPQFDCSGTGDYLQIVAAGGIARPFWTDTRTGSNQIFTAAIDELAMAGTAPPQAHFETGRDYGVGLQPQSLAVGDLTGNGIPDLVVGQGSKNVLLGRGDGTFTPGPPPSPSGALPLAVRLADLNGDGKLDMVTAAGSASPIRVYYGNGNGSFTAGPTYSPGASDIALADLYGNGKQDLISTGPVNTINIWSGVGGGTFAQPVAWPAADTPTDIAVADLNGDGRPDIVVTGKTVAVLMQNATQGFTTATYAVGGQGKVAIADVNGDGKPDIVVSDPSAGVVRVLLNNGNGTFAAPVSYPALSQPEGIAIADLNGDGKPDIIVANMAQKSSTVSVLYGNGDGTFQAPIAYATDTGSTALVVADFDRDGKPDVAVANFWANTVSILLGDGKGLRAPRRYAVGGRPAGIATADLNGDGKPDVVVANQASNDISVLMDEGDGTLAAEQRFPTGGTPIGVIIADVNGDHRPDLVVPHGSDVAVLLGNGDGTFQAPILTPVTPYGINQLIVADFNGDGKADIAFTTGTSNVVVMLGKGDGTFQPPVAYPIVASGAAGDSYGITAGDFNGDGKLDLAIVSKLNHTLSILLGNGDGTFRPPLTYDTNPNPVLVTSADFDGDGTIDLAVATQSETVSIFPGHGDGTFGVPGQAVAATNNPVSFLSTDINRDGRPDLVVANAGTVGTLSGNVYVLTGLGDATFLPNLDWPSVTAVGMPTPAGAAIADFNGDGRPDLVAASSTAELGVEVVLAVGSQPAVTPATIGFPSTPARSISASQTIHLTNNGSEALHVALTGITGSNADQFAKRADQCSGATLSPGQSCTVQVAFAPASVGGKSAQLAIVDDAAGSPQLVNLNGTALIKNPRSESSTPPVPASSPLARNRANPPSSPPRLASHVWPFMRLAILHLRLVL